MLRVLGDVCNPPIRMWAASAFRLAYFAPNVHLSEILRRPWEVAFAPLAALSSHAEVGH